MSNQFNKKSSSKDEFYLGLKNLNHYADLIRTNINNVIFTYNRIDNIDFVYNKDFDKIKSMLDSIDKTLSNIIKKLNIPFNETEKGQN